MTIFIAWFITLSKVYKQFQNFNVSTFTKTPELWKKSVVETVKTLNYYRGHSV